MQSETFLSLLLVNHVPSHVLLACADTQASHGDDELISFSSDTNNQLINISTISSNTNSSGGTQATETMSSLATGATNSQSIHIST